MRRVTWIAVLVLGVLAGSRLARLLAQETSALINKALDEQLPKLELDKPLPQAMEQITQLTGVRLREDPLVWDVLPSEISELIKAKIENLTLREALTAIVRKLGLQLVLRDQYVEIQPMPGLARLGQRASIDELKAMDLLSSRPAALKNEYPTVRELLEAVDLKLEAEKEVQVAIENRIGEAVPMNRTVFVPRNATLMDALESLPKETKATWYPWGKSIVVTTKENRTRRLLEKPLTIRTGERGMDVMQLLGEISARTKVPIDYQPGVIQTVPLEARNVRGVVENAPAHQILEEISASTGLLYAIEDEKVTISSPQAAGGAAPRDPAVGLIQLDNGMQILVPSSQVPADMREYLRQKTEKKLAEIRQMMNEEGWKPATQPAAGANQDL